MISPEWEPHTAVLRHGIYASKFPAGVLTLWTLINRNEFDVDGSQIQIPHQRDAHYFNLWNGAELKPELHDGHAILSFSMEAHGYGAVLGSTARVADLERFLGEMKALAQTSLAAYSPERRLLTQQLVPIAPVKSITQPEGMIRIPAGAFRFRIAGIEIEGKNEIGVMCSIPGRIRRAVIMITR